MSRLAAALEGAVSVEAAPSRRGLVRDTSALVERNAVVGPGPTARPAEVIDRVIDRERLPVDGSEARVAPETLAQSVVGRKRRQKKSRSRSFFFLRRAGFLGRADGVEPRRLRGEGKIRRRLKRGGVSGAARRFANPGARAAKASPRAGKTDRPAGTRGGARGAARSRSGARGGGSATREGSTRGHGARARASASPASASAVFRRGPAPPSWSGTAGTAEGPGEDGTAGAALC